MTKCYCSNYMCNHWEPYCNTCTTGTQTGLGTTNQAPFEAFRATQRDSLYLSRGDFDRKILSNNISNWLSKPNIFYSGFLASQR
jgi:hypothetical protein